MARRSATCCQSRAVSSACAVQPDLERRPLGLETLDLGDQQRREEVIADGLQSPSTVTTRFGSTGSTSSAISPYWSCRDPSSYSGR